MQTCRTYTPPFSASESSARSDLSEIRSTGARNRFRPFSSPARFCRAPMSGQVQLEELAIEQLSQIKQQLDEVRFVSPPELR